MATDHSENIPSIPKPAATQGGETPASSSLRVLIVDDNVDAAESLGMLLTLEEHDTQTVFSGEEALIRAAEFHPEVVLLDIGLPCMDGYEVARCLRKAPLPNRPMLVALTGHSGKDALERAKQAGFDAHLVKPVNFGALQKLLNATVDAR